MAEIVPGGGSTLVAGTRDGDVLLFVTDPVKGLHCTRKLKAHSPGPKIPELSGGGVTLSGVRCLALPSCASQSKSNFAKGLPRIF